MAHLHSPGLRRIRGGIRVLLLRPLAPAEDAHRAEDRRADVTTTTRVKASRADAQKNERCG